MAGFQDSGPTSRLEGTAIGFDSSDWTVYTGGGGDGTDAGKYLTWIALAALAVAAVWLRRRT